VNRLPLAFLGASSTIFFVASALYVAYLRRRRPETAFWAHAAAVSGWLTLSLGGLVRLALLGRLPFGSFSDSLMLLLWALVAGFLWLEHRFALRAAGALIIPVIAVGSAYIFWRPAGGGELLPILTSPWVVAHAACIFAGYCAFTLAAVAGALYLLLEKELKEKRLFSLHFTLPSLDTLERLVSKLILWGFPFLTVGLASGAVWSRRVWGTYVPFDAKMIVALVTWFIYAAELIYTRALGGRGRRVAIASLIGLAAVALNYLALGVLVDTVHRF